MKKIIIIIAIISIAIVSCKKEEIKETSKSNEIQTTKDENNINVDRFFDSLYLKNLIIETGIYPKNLAKNDLFIQYDLMLDGLFNCLSEVMFSTLSSDLPRKNHVLSLLEQANQYFNNNDNINGFQILENIYTYLGCRGNEIVVYEGRNFYIPYLQIENNFNNLNVIYEKLLLDFPNLNEINEYQKNDLFVFASLIVQSNKTQQNPCSSQYKARMRVVRSEWESCISGALGGGNQWAIIIAGTVCNLRAYSATIQAGNAYNACMGY